MAGKAKVVFVLFEGLNATVIDSQVLQHVRVMQDAGLAEFHIVALACDDDGYRLAQQRHAAAQEMAQAPITVARGVRPGLPWSIGMNAARLRSIVDGLGFAYTHIHARTEYSAAVCARALKHPGTVLVWDCRGDALAEKAAVMGAGVLAKIKTMLANLVLKHRLALAGRASDRAIFVTQALADVMRPWWGEKPCEIIPGAASDEMFFFDEDVRASKRKQLGLADKDVLLIYGGGMSHYQKFAATLDVFDALRKADPQVRYLVLTNQVDKAKGMVGAREGVQIDTAKLADMNGFLNAADAAFMIRDRVALNRVAFPTKFAEYGLCGLPVITTDGATPDACDMAKAAGNFVDVETVTHVERLDNPARRRVADFYRARVTKRAQMGQYGRIYAP